jgi:hypothetical protein
MPGSRRGQEGTGPGRRRRAGGAAAVTRRGIGAVLAAVLVVVAVACSSSGGADERALPDPDARPIAVATNAALVGAHDLETFDDGNGHAEVAGGVYQLGLRTGQAVVTAPLPRAYPRDQVVTATFETAGSPPDAGFGVVCRMQDEKSYYRLGVSNDGQYAIQRVRAGETTVLTDGKWQANEAIRATPGPYAVRGECIGDTLTLFESNHEIASVRDRTIRGPHVGVFLESFAEPNPVIKVTTLAVRAFDNRERVTESTVDAWDDLMRTQQVSRSCALLDPKGARTGKGALYASRCGPVTFVAMRTPKQGAREFARLLQESGAELKPVADLPSCPKRTGVRGPLPAPPAATAATATTDPPRLGTVACLELDGATGVVWVHTLPGVVGVRRVATTDRAAWKGYGPDWPAFALRERPLGALGEVPPG